jgi:hypothetical protein
MLFDLRGRGRRRTVQIIYAGLALLIGFGLIGLGVGGGFGSGGILSGLTGEEGSGSASFAAQVQKYEKAIHKNPNDVHAWEQLTLAQLHEAGGETYVVDGKLTSKGKELYVQIAQSWNHYLALNPSGESIPLAKEMVTVFGEEGLNEPAEAVKVLQLIVAAEPTNSSYYRFLAEYAYKAHNTRIGDLASEKAVALAPASERKQLKTALAEVKKNAASSSSTSSSASSSTSGAATTGSSGAAATGASSGSASGASSGSGTVTIGGKTYHLPSNVNKQVQEQLDAKKAAGSSGSSTSGTTK